MDEIKVRRVAGRGHHLHRGQPDAQAIIWQGRVNRSVPIAVCYGTTRNVTHQAADVQAPLHRSACVAVADATHPAAVVSHQSANVGPTDHGAGRITVDNVIVRIAHQTADTVTGCRHRPGRIAVADGSPIVTATGQSADKAVPTHAAGAVTIVDSAIGNTAHQSTDEIATAHRARTEAIGNVGMDPRVVATPIPQQTADVVRAARHRRIARTMQDGATTSDEPTDQATHVGTTVHRATARAVAEGADGSGRADGAADVIGPMDLTAGSDRADRAAVIPNQQSDVVLAGNGTSDIRKADRRASVQVTEQANVITVGLVDGQVADAMASAIQGAGKGGNAIAHRIEAHACIPGAGATGIDVVGELVGHGEPTAGHALEAVDVRDLIGVAAAVSAQGAHEGTALEGEILRAERRQYRTHLTPGAASLQVAVGDAHAAAGGNRTARQSEICEVQRT